MLCPKCDENTRVIDTRKSDHANINKYFGEKILEFLPRTIVRRRECKNVDCNYRFNTFEVRESNIIYPKDDLNQLIETIKLNMKTLEEGLKLVKYKLLLKE